MGRHTLFVYIALTLIWIVLTEEISWRSMAMGMFATIICLHFSGKFLPYEEIKKVNFLRLITFPFFLIGQIYSSGFQVIKIIIKGHKLDIVTVRTKIQNETLRVMLADTITLTPGSIMLDLVDDFVVILWMREKDNKADSETAGEIIKGKLERGLLKAEKIIDDTPRKR
ncbi:MAG: Na+/H+ antiporter subunit E [Defluviitaleaceae bacterium]|nr:Na+/H+ antiporter subunit E [Defluviitaleaceae bacterium]